MKFSRTFTNKLVSFADRHFTWDSRTMKRENPDANFEFFAISRDDGIITSVCISRTKYGVWVSIRKDGRKIYGQYLETYAEATVFKKMIRCLG